EADVGRVPGAVRRIARDLRRLRVSDLDGEAPGRDAAAGVFRGARDDRRTECEEAPGGRGTPDGGCRIERADSGDEVAQVRTVGAGRLGGEVARKPKARRRRAEHAERGERRDITADPLDH